MKYLLTSLLLLINFISWAQPNNPPIVGCVDSLAINWNPWATADDSSCVFPPVDNCISGYLPLTVTITPDTWSNFETGWSVVDISDTSSEVLLYEVISNTGAYSGGVGISVETLVCVPLGGNIEFEITDVYGDGLNGAQFGGLDGSCLVTLCDSVIYTTTPDNIDFDYSDTVTFIASCGLIEEVLGCTNIDYLEYNPEATTDDNSCLTPVVLGCIDNTQFNYDSLANVEAVVEECSYTLIITDGVGDGWFGNWLGIKQGDWISPQFQMSSEDGFEKTFILDLNSFEPVEAYFFSPTIQSQNTLIQCGFELMSPTGELVIDVNQFFVIPFPNTYSGQPYCGNTCEPFIYGCLDTEAINFIEEANTEDNSCYYSPGCVNPIYLEYYTQGFEADYDDGSCETPVMFGCTDEIACNYDSEANLDFNDICSYADEGYDCGGNCLNDVDGDGVCDEDEIVGCTDVNAYNYDILATEDEGCLYDSGCIGDPGDPYWLNDACYAYVISLVESCCNQGWDSSCQEVYDWCAENEIVVGVDNYQDDQIIIFPNPTTGIINIASKLQLKVDIYNSIGQNIFNGFNINQVNMERFETGIYTLVLTYNDLQFTKKIAKQ